MMDGYFEVYRSGIFIKEWRWRFRAKNGKVIYATTEGYRNKMDCTATIPVLEGKTREWREYA